MISSPPPLSRSSLLCFVVMGIVSRTSCMQGGALPFSRILSLILRQGVTKLPRVTLDSHFPLAASSVGSYGLYHQAWPFLKKNKLFF